MQMGDWTWLVLGTLPVLAGLVIWLLAPPDERRESMRSSYYTSCKRCGKKAVGGRGYCKKCQKDVDLEDEERRKKQEERLLRERKKGGRT